jgi:hypothetical protein
MKLGGRSETSAQSDHPQWEPECLYVHMKLGATPGFIGTSLPFNGHETRSLLHGSC